MKKRCAASDLFWAWVPRPRHGARRERDNAHAWKMLTKSKQVEVALVPALHPIKNNN
ncbi:MAG: hypothetical protein HN975_11695 [Anaerolineae bacterium]|nr:hypothetical protein [Anaerolineae bacterium]